LGTWIGQPLLKLRIENYDQLPDGGPLEFIADRRGFDFGREQHLDWTLPDDTGVISRKHCEVRFFEQAYWLFDLSTNGTFVNRSQKRVQSPYKLADGDELRIGDYVISVSIPRLNPAEPLSISPQPSPALANQDPGNIWDTDDPGPRPIDPRELMPAPPERRRTPDFLHQVVRLPPVADEGPRPKPREQRVPYAPPQNLWEDRSESPAPPVSQSPAPESDPLQSGEMPFQPSAPMYSPQPLQAETGIQPATRSSTESAAAPTAGGASAHMPNTSEYMARFAKGVGLPPEQFSNRDPGEVAEEAGLLLNAAVAQIMQLLSARAAAKAMAKSSKHTFIRPAENNPLKFTPSAEEALRVLLGPPSKGYLPAKQAIDSSLEDIMVHQMAMLSAMQKAAAQIFDDLSPEAIKKEADTGKRSLLAAGKGKYWQAYAEKWAELAGRHEHGMLGAFLDLFAKFYDEQSSGKK
jgi:type VI secretion system protein ImpI